jgi:hypothetical protein
LVDRENPAFPLNQALRLQSVDELADAPVDKPSSSAS